MSALQPKYSRVSLAVKYASVLFPFDIVAFLISLSRRDFFLPEALEKSILAAPHGARLEPSGTVARKGEISVRINADRRVLAVDSLGPQDVSTEMEALESLLKDEFKVDSSGQAQFYELVADLTIEGTASPLKSWAEHLEKVPIIQQVSDLIGIDVSSFGLRFVPKGRIPNQTDWFDIRVEPSVHAPENHHDVNIVFRDHARDKVFAFVDNLEQSLDGLISLVEGPQAQ